MPLLEFGFHEDLFKLILESSGPWDEVLSIARDDLLRIAGRYRVDWLGTANTMLGHWKRMKARVAAASRLPRTPDPEEILDWRRELWWTGE